MNTERLYAIATKIHSDFEESTLLDTLSNLKVALKAQMTSPTAVNIGQIEDNISELRALKTQGWFHYPETWSTSIEYIGAARLKNASFVDEIEQVVRENNITLESASKSVTAIHTQLSNVQNALEQVIVAFDALGIDGYELSEGNAELSVLVPRVAFDNTIKCFAKDISNIARFFELAEEMSTGSRTPPTLDELSTTDPVIIAGVSISACLFVLKVVREIIKTITSTYELREARAKALTAEASKKTLDSMDQDIKKRIDDGLKTVVDEMLKEYKSTVRGRTQELKSELRQSLPQMAARIDNGYRIDGTAGVAEETEEENAGQNEQANEVNSISNSISYISLPATPVLQISLVIQSENTNSEQDDNADDETAADKANAKRSPKAEN